jgi:hypothetical protein
MVRWFGRLMCRLGLHKWGPHRVIFVCERDDCFAERERKQP